VLVAAPAATKRGPPGGEIPAFAGMTRGMVLVAVQIATSVATLLPRNDKEGVGIFHETSPILLDARFPLSRE